MNNVELAWLAVPVFLESGECGDYVKEGNREVEVANMVGGRYLLWEDGDVAGQTDDVSDAVLFLKGGNHE